MPALKSNNLRRVYTSWAESASPDEVEFVDSVYELCEKNYEAGGDLIVEAWGPKEILDHFSGKDRTLNSVKELIGLQVENATNYRLGEDDDPELETLRRFEEAEW